MNCFFKTDIKKVKIPFLSKLPLKILYFSHSIISDIKEKKSYPLINFISIISRDSFSKPLLFINYINPTVEKNYINCVIEETKKFVYRLKNENVDLELTSIKKPLLEGGNGYINLNHKKTYYYSLTNLKTKGKIKIKNKWIDINGKSWMDRQWANESFSEDKWVWFSIQLNNKTEMVCFIYGDKEIKTYLASISYPDNKQEHFKEFEIIPLGMEWTSPKTKAVYPLKWRIKAPSRDIDLEVVPLIKEQEMLFGSINYWEGPIKINGLFNHKKVKGVGFMELVGCPSEYNNVKYAKDELGRLMNQVFAYAKKETFNIVDNITTRIIK
jgi:predicted secreted hydrolase